jgi:hypothetical protein
MENMETRPEAETRCAAQLSQNHPQITFKSPSAHGYSAADFAQWLQK